MLIIWFSLLILCAAVLLIALLPAIILNLAFRKGLLDPSHGTRGTRQSDLFED